MFREVLTEGSSYGITYPVTRKEFDQKKFQQWIKKDLGKVIPGGKTSESVYLNKAGQTVFMYDFRKNELTILQSGLELQQLVMYGLGVSAVVPPIK